MIKLKDILMEIFKGSIPRYLFHGTFYPLLQSIQVSGIVPGGKGFRNYHWSDKSGVYLTNRKHTALDMVLSSESQKTPELWLSDAIVLTIDISKLDDKKLFEKDPYLDFGHLATKGPFRRGKYPPMSFLYRGTIPANAIVNVERHHRD